MPSEEEEAGTDPQMVEQGEVQQSRYAFKRLDRAGGGDQTCRALYKQAAQCGKDKKQNSFFLTIL